MPFKLFAKLHAATETVVYRFAKQDDGYVQEALHKEVGYKTAGKATLSPAKTKVYKFVKANFQIPQHFDKLHRCALRQATTVTYYVHAYSFELGDAHERYSVTHTLTRVSTCVPDHQRLSHCSQHALMKLCMMLAHATGLGH